MSSIMLDAIEAGNPSALILDEKHPGINDKDYMARRSFFFDMARKYRLSGKSWPVIDFSEEEHRIWRYVSEKLADAHERLACDLYLKGKRQLQINTDRIPQLAEMNDRLKSINGFQLLPAEGLLHTRSFFSYLTQNKMPCTQFLRHGKDPAYTPEPDMVHDVLGHTPPLVNEDYIEITRLIGEAVMAADETQLIAWGRVYWFAIEFSLIEEKDAVKVFGAGHLSSFGEIEHVFSDAVDRRPFKIEEVIETDYDTTKMQDVVFVIPSLACLKDEILKLRKMQSLVVPAFTG